MILNAEMFSIAKDSKDNIIMHVAENQIDNIHNILLSDSPNPRQLEEELTRELNISQEDSTQLIYRVIAKINGAFFPPITKLELILTESCNLACTYCFEKRMHSHKEMEFEVAKAAIDLLFDYSRNEPVLCITYFGGEPTLNFPAIQVITEYAEHRALQAGKSVEFTMTSNGTLLTDTMVDYFILHKIKVLLSIDGLEATHNRFRGDKYGKGSFNQVINGLEILKKKQLWIGVKMTVMPQNVPSLYEDIIGLFNKGINQFIIGHATGLKWSEEDMRSFVEQLNKVYQWYRQISRNILKISEFEERTEKSAYFGCQAGRDCISISINGEISPCSKILALDNSKPMLKLGDIRYGLTNFNNRFELLRCSKLRSACEALTIAEFFQGGCFAANYEDNHDLFQPSMQEYIFSMWKRSIFSEGNLLYNQIPKRFTPISLSRKF